MANRSDFNSAFPRALKRMWMLGKFNDAQHAADVKRLFIEAHKVHKAAKNKKVRRDQDATGDSEE